MEVLLQIIGHLVINFLGFQVELPQVSTNMSKLEEVTDKVNHLQILIEIRIPRSEGPAMVLMDTAYQIQISTLIP
jgi:hypothetical protein